MKLQAVKSASLPPPSPTSAVPTTAGPSGLRAVSVGGSDTKVAPASAVPSTLLAKPSKKVSANVDADGVTLRGRPSKFHALVKLALHPYVARYALNLHATRRGDNEAKNRNNVINKEAVDVVGNLTAYRVENCAKTFRVKDAVTGKETEVPNTILPLVTKNLREYDYAARQVEEGKRIAFREHMHPVSAIMHVSSWPVLTDMLR
jgi:hypothetical protein